MLSDINLLGIVKLSQPTTGKSSRPVDAGGEKQASGSKTKRPRKEEGAYDHFIQWLFKLIVMHTLYYAEDANSSDEEGRPRKTKLKTKFPRAVYEGSEEFGKLRNQGLTSES